VFALGAVFYFWRATYAMPLVLHGGESTAYNQLADAFIHLHLWVVHVPASALGPGNQYNPEQRSAFLLGYPDYALYGPYLYISWGPVPALLLVPAHLLGFEPSGSFITTPLAIAGLGFALMALRVMLRRVGRSAPVWMVVLAGLTLTCASVLPYDLRFPIVYHEELLGGYCFAMAAVWLGASAVIDSRDSLWRLALMSLCIGLATGSRVTLGAMGLLLVAVYVALHRGRPTLSLLAALGAPFGVCVALLAAYNQARFGSVVDNGVPYQINGISTYHAHLGELSFLAPGLWSYLLAPPRLIALFPYFAINYPQVSYPFALPAHYASLSEETGGLLPMAPLAIFVVALPWVWRRRPALLGSLAPLLLAMVAAGMLSMCFVAYEVYISTERYETDYMVLFLFAALSVWLALACSSGIRRRRLIAIIGGVLALWSCATGMAISYQEIEQHPGTWRNLVDLGSPLSTAIAEIAGHPVLAEVYTPNIQRNPPDYSNLGTEVTGFSLHQGTQADITIVSPNAREEEFVANTEAGPALPAGASLEVRIEGPGGALGLFRLARDGDESRLRLHLNRGVNQFVLSLAGEAGVQGAPESEAESQPVVTFTNVALAHG
jgi:hypothetical protein